jgi:hypothetical protein
MAAIRQAQGVQTDNVIRLGDIQRSRFVRLIGSLCCAMTNLPSSHFLNENQNRLYKADYKPPQLLLPTLIPPNVDERELVCRQKLKIKI